jgi:hypothetical protein
MIQDLTGGRPFIFVAMPFDSRALFYDRLKSVIEKETRMGCIRADDVKASGHDLLDKIHKLIDRCELVVGEISDQRPNVFYELGYAVGHQMPVLLLKHADSQVPTDLRGLELISYDESRSGLDRLEGELRHHLRARLGARGALLRDMLEAELPTPVYILASPRYPGKDSKNDRSHFDTQTFGDYLGIKGLITAFGAIQGEGAHIELISAQHCPDDIVDRDANFFLIGSKKSNTHGGRMLERLTRGYEPGWGLGARTRNEERDDYKVRLFRASGGKRTEIEASSRRDDEGGLVHTVDHGLIVRGPHPTRKDRLVTCIAGPHSLGTGAACLAATRSRLIEQIKGALPTGSDLGDKTRTLWVLVRGEANDQGMLDESGVSIVEAGMYPTSRRGPRPQRTYDLERSRGRSSPQKSGRVPARRSNSIRS